MSRQGQERSGTSADEQRLAELGYRQELDRSWSGFSNFAISFTIISILSGCFTTYGQAWLNGGPVAISWGWPIVSAFILVIAFCMAELVSAFPTAGGIYWWAAELGGPVWGWFTGWFNLIGLIAVTASVDYGAATFASILYKLYNPDFAASLGQIFAIFVVILALHAVINIFSAHLVAMLNTVSAYWHVAGVTLIVGILVFGPDTHQSVSFVFTETFNKNGFSDSLFWFYVLPLGFLLTQYTITGYDASAHLSEETHDAATSAARGVWRSVLYSAVAGYVLLLAFTFAATDVQAIDDAFGYSTAIFTSALSDTLAKTVIIVSLIGQLFCGMACVTSGSRMLFAFSRDRAVPGHALWSSLTANRVPANAVLAVCVAALLITLPALRKSEVTGGPAAFFAIVSIAVVALYIAYAIPIYLRLRAGDSFRPGPWNLGSRYRILCTVAVAWVALTTIIFCLPLYPGAVPGDPAFDIALVNYAPILIGLVILSVGLWWVLSARRWFTGPVRNVDAELAPLQGD